MMMMIVLIDSKDNAECTSGVGLLLQRSKQLSRSVMVSDVGGQFKPLRATVRKRKQKSFDSDYTNSTTEKEEKSPQRYTHKHTSPHAPIDLERTAAQVERGT